LIYLKKNNTNTNTYTHFMPDEKDNKNTIIAVSVISGVAILAILWYVFRNRGQGGNLGAAGYNVLMG
jgi:hypothetical protein